MVEVETKDEDCWKWRKESSKWGKLMVEVETKDEDSWRWRKESLKRRKLDGGS